MGADQPENPLLNLWLRQYPFSYWDNRIEKINPYNPEDRLEALFVLLQLADLYTHIFTARVRNPDQPWFMVKEKTYGHDISETLNKLSKETEWGNHVFVETLAENPEGLISFKKNIEGWDVPLREWIAVDFLGCPVEFHPNEQEIEPLEDIDLHYAAANATLNFWRENKALLNDFKHGFRVLPFDQEALQFLIQEYFPDAPEEVEETKENIARAEESNQWAQHFVRMETQKPEEDVWYDYQTSIHLHRANATACVDMAELILHQLFNLFGTGGDYKIEDELLGVMTHGDPDDLETLELIEHIAEFPVLYSPGEDGE